jgi:hypothetical protein
MPYVALILGTVLAFFAYAYSRVMGFGITALCAAATAYFLMTPVRSIRVSQIEDLLALSAYCIVSGVVLPFRQSRQRRSIGEGLPAMTSTSCFGADLSAAFAELSSCSELKGRLLATHIDVQNKLTIRCLPRDAFRILSDISRVALDDAEVRGLSLDVCPLPGRDLSFVTAHRVWPHPLLESVTIGKGEKDCEPIHFPAWPRGWSATWFDNGYVGIYQVSISTERASLDFDRAGKSRFRPNG